MIMLRGWQTVATIVVISMLASCTLPPPASSPVSSSPPIHDVGAVSSIARAQSRWVPVPWSDLPGFDEDTLHEAWNAWLKSCERPASAFVTVCPDVRRLSIATADEQRAWMMQRLQPYRIEALNGQSQGLLTAYFEPVLDAFRKSRPGYSAALYRLPAQWGRPWFTRAQMDTLPQAQSALHGREIAYVADPLDAMSLQIQGSGRLRITEADGSVRTVRLSFAASNEQPYRSIGSWILQQGNWRDVSWPGIKTWLTKNPERKQELLWSNPRVVFFKEEVLNASDAELGPRGAQGVPLTPGRSIAVDPGSIAYGTPVWLVSPGPALVFRKLVLAQDTGSAIVGAVRADYFVGTGPQAGELAGRVKQPLHMWALWPR